MCIEIINYKKQHHNDFSYYFHLKQIDYDAEVLLNQFLNNNEYNLKLNKRRVPVIEIAEQMGFKIFLARFSDRNLSGTIGISSQLKKQYKSDKVIILNNQDTDGHILFTLCHEIAHYIYDYRSDIEKEYANTYRTDEIKDDSEIRANRFAAAFLMPRKSFEEAYEELSRNVDNIELIVQGLSEAFDAPQTAVMKRMKELELI